MDQYGVVGPAATPDGSRYSSGDYRLGGVEYTRIEHLHRSENGPIAERAEFAGVADTATFAMHAIEASFAFAEGWAVDETDNDSEEQQSPPAL